MSPKLLLGLALLLAGFARGQLLSPLAEKPNWAELEAFQETMTREDFVRLLDGIYAPGGAAKDCLEVQAEGAVIKTTLTPPATWTLRFAAQPEQAKAAPRFWRTPVQMGPAPAGLPLAGVKIAIDAGHLGGAWARMEERFFQIGESKPVVEGDMTLLVARLLEPRLKALGAEVTFLRHSADPVTPLRSDTLRPAARAELQRLGFAEPRENYQGLDDALRGRTVQGLSEIFFYRTSEIRHRAQVVNTTIRPDLTLCLHFNAEAWGDPLKPEFVPRNHLHVLLNGSYGAEELQHDDVRFEMLRKLLGRCYDEEFAAAGVVSAALAAESKLPAYNYTTPNAIPVGGNGYLWARNLLANRLYQTPVIFLEPYVMNSEIVWERVQAGDYDGVITLGGEARKSIFREYADAVANGLRDYYTTARSAAGK